MMSKDENLVPVLRFPEFDSGWKIYELGEFIDERKNVASSDLPLYSLTIESGIVPKSKRYERSFLVKSGAGAYKRMKPKDFAYNPMNLRWGALACHHGDKDVAVSKYYDVFSVNEKSLPQYLEPFLTSYKMVKFYDRMSTGTLEEKKRVHYLDFIHFKKLFPTLPEQKKIADFLTSVDDRIGQLIKKKALLEDYKKGVMQQLFSQQIRFKDDNGNDFPDWEEKKLGEVMKTVSPSGHQIESSAILPEGVFRVIDQGKVKVAGYCNDPNRVMADIPVIVFGDHTTTIKYIDFEFVVGADGTKILTSKSAEHELKYFYYNLVHNNVPQEGYKRHFSILKEISLQVPSNDEQKKIADFLSSIDQKIESVSQQIAKTQTFKKGLLQQMFV